MRIVSWNLHGAAIPSRATIEQQHQAWTYMRDVLSADVILAQEVSAAGMPSWVADDWTAVSGEHGRFRKNWNWGSVIAAKRDLRIRQHVDWLADPWLAQLYDLVMIGQLELPGCGPTLVASVHTAALPVGDWVRNYAKSLSLSADEMASLRRPACKEDPFINDLAFTALERTIGGGRFIVAGDWNTCRQYPGGPAFVLRAQSRGWVECHQEPEEQSYFGRTSSTYQLDHAFCDSTTGAAIRSCQVLADETVLSLSDHAPLVVDLALE